MPSARAASTADDLVVEAPDATSSSPWRRHALAIVMASVVAVALASLLLPVTLAFDPWAWLVWGREVGRLDLDTTGGPSWKPLPVVVTTLVAPAGAAAPFLWLAIARAASLLALVGAYRLGERLAGRWAGAIAAALLVVTPDTGSRFLRLLFEGHSATIGVTFALWAIVRHLEGVRSQTLLLVFGLALIRPEAWPFLGVYAAWLWWRDPPRRPLLAAVLLAIPVLWLGGDWWGSGSPLHGADAAQVASGGTLDRLTLALERAWKVVPLPVWIAAALSLLLRRPGPEGGDGTPRGDAPRVAHRSAAVEPTAADRAVARGSSAAGWAAGGSTPAEPVVSASPVDRSTVAGWALGRSSAHLLPIDIVLGGVALAWTAIVVVMAAALGYAALSRFYLPAGALLCVLAGVGVVRAARLAPALRLRFPLVDGAPASALRAATVVVIVLVSLPGLVPRVTALDRLFDEARTRHRLADTLDEAIDDAGGRDAVVRCGTVSIDQSGLGGPLRPGIAWKLDVPLHRIGRRLNGDPGVLFVRTGGREEARLLSSAGADASVIGRSADWIVYAVGCDPATGD